MNITPNTLTKGLLALALMTSTVLAGFAATDAAAQKKKSKKSASNETREVLYLETFGKTPEQPKLFNLIGFKDPVGEPIVRVGFSREGQPLATYVRETNRTNIRHETAMYPQPKDYKWASGSPVLHTAKGFRGVLVISGLDIEGADGIQFDFGYRSGAEEFQKDVTIEYSNDGGRTWVPVDWKLTRSYVKGKYIVARTTGKISGSANFSLRLTMNVAPTATDVRIDDLRLTGIAKP